MSDPINIVRTVHSEWLAAARIADPDEGGGLEDDEAFWAEVDARLVNTTERCKGSD